MYLIKTKYVHKLIINMNEDRDSDLLIEKNTFN